jgi:hypothetical protein
MSKRALLIGINYFTNSTARLSGCIEDINNIYGMLIDAYGYQHNNIAMLRDDDSSRMPTRANILAALQNIVAVSGANDEIWIHYSGHGTQVRDVNGDEPDRIDEAIVPVDFTTVGMIIDDELFNIVRNIRCRATLVFDSCHSGSICDLPYSINYNPGGTLTKSITSNKLIIGNPNIIVISGCRDPQTSADSFDASTREASGALTMTLIASLRKTQHYADILKVYRDMCASLAANQYTQVPVLSSTTPNPVLQFARALPPLARPAAAPLVLPLPKPTAATTKPGKDVSQATDVVFRLGARPYSSRRKMVLGI